MATIKDDSRSVIVNRSARFQLLSAGLVRMEYSPSGSFEDRGSARTDGRPAPVAFTRVTDEADGVHLAAGDWELVYSGDGRPLHGGARTSAPNLAAVDFSTGEAFWNPGSVDTRNLGAVHHSADYATPGMLPSGVHPATCDYHPIESYQNLWTFKGRLRSGLTDELHAGLENAERFNEVLDMLPFDELPESVQELMRERWKYPPGLLSRSGYFLYNDSATPLLNEDTGWLEDRAGEAGYRDWYLFYYRDDFRRAFRDYRLLFGAVPLIPRYALGLWYSRFPTLPDRQMRELVQRFAEHDLPLDVLVLDLEWHKYGWHGFDWDTNLIPNPDDFLASLHDHDVRCSLNVHPNGIPVEDSRYPEFVEAANIDIHDCDLSPDRRDNRPKLTDFDIGIREHADAFLNVLHKPVQDQGIDFWWIDGRAPMMSVGGLDPLYWTDHVYFRHISENYPDRRPMILSRHPGPGAHRYPIAFSGDTWSYWEVLENQVEQTLRAGHLGESFISHDIGGHISSFVFIDPELYVRWLHFGVLSPIVRLHSARISEGVGGERRPWMYGERVLESFRTSMQLRMELLPYLYTLCHESAQTGLPMCRSNCIQEPAWEAGYHEWSSYFLGDRLYAAPVVTPGTTRSVSLPPGSWYNGLTGRRYESDGAAAITQVSPFDRPPLHYYRGGTAIVKQPYTHRASGVPESLILELFPLGRPCTDAFELYEDDGYSRRHENGEQALTSITMTEQSDAITVALEPVRGEYRGMPETRSYEIRVHALDDPTCTVDGSRARSASTASVQAFRTNALSVREPHTIVVRSRRTEHGGLRSEGEGAR